RHRRIVELLKKSRGAFQDRRFEEGGPLAAEILEVDAGHQEASDLRAKANAPLERQRLIQSLLEAAPGHKAGPERGPALEKANEGLRLGPGNAEFLSIQRWAASTLERQQRVNALLKGAQQYAAQGDWEFCRKKAEEGLKLAPGHEELQQLYNRSQQELE